MKIRQLKGLVCWLSKVLTSLLKNLSKTQLVKRGLDTKKSLKGKEIKMLITFDEIIELTLEHEGGYVHDPKDLGGETNFGIAKRFYPDVDIKNLTKEGAKDIYRKDYWDKNKVDDLPDNLKHIFFDMCVNQGRGTAVKILQRACNAKGADLAIDGGFGPGTKGAVETYKPSVERVRCYRLKHYYDLVNKKPEQERFLFGWYRRALSV
jgi:lysozyme family protein